MYSMTFKHRKKMGLDEIDRYIALREKQLRVLKAKRISFIHSHMRKHPLSKETKVLIRERFGTHKKPLCCKKGLRWLRANTDRVWAYAVNAWAYESLGCDSFFFDNTRHGIYIGRLEDMLSEPIIPPYYLGADANHDGYGAQLHRRPGVIRSPMRSNMLRVRPVHAQLTKVILVR